MAALAGHVSVRDVNGQVHVFGPGDEVPEWAAKQITNPRLWEDSEVPFPAKRPKGEGPKSPAAAGPVPQVAAADLAGLEDRVVGRVLEGVGELLQDLLTVDDDPADDGEPVAEVGPPPRSGRGSGEKEWRAYAAAKGVDVDAIEERNEIIAYLAQSGIPVE